MSKKKCQKVLITGGSRGIGRGIAYTLNKEGYKVIAIGKSEKPEFLSLDIKYIQADLSTSDEAILSTIFSFKILLTREGLARP